MTGVSELTKEKLVLSEDVEDILMKKAVPIGNKTHVTYPEKHTGKKAYLVVDKG